MNEWVRNPDPGEDAVSSVFDLPLWTRRWDLNFHAPQSLVSLLDPQFEIMFDLVKTVAQVSIWRWGTVNQFWVNDYIVNVMR